MHRFWGLTFGIVLLAIFVLSAVAPWMPGWWLPMPASTYAPDVDRLFYLILAVVTFFYVLTEILLVFNIVRWAGPRRSEFSHGDKKLELVWSIVPAVILILIAVLQVKAWANIKYPDSLAQSIESGKDKYLQLGVEARQWEFRVRYPSPERMAEWDDNARAKDEFKRRLDERFDDTWVANDVHVWKNQKVLLHMKTRDVIHSVFFPNLRLKQDILPGRTIPAWFEATEANTRAVEVNGQRVWQDGWRYDEQAKEWRQDKAFIFDLVCTQYCGTRHSLMRGKLFVHQTREDYMDWLRHARNITNIKQAPPSAVSASP